MGTWFSEHSRRRQGLICSREANIGDMAGKGAGRKARLTSKGKSLPLNFCAKSRSLPPSRVTDVEFPSNLPHPVGCMFVSGRRRTSGDASLPGASGGAAERFSGSLAHS